MHELSLYMLAVIIVWGVILKYLALWQFTHSATPAVNTHPLRMIAPHAGTGKQVFWHRNIFRP